MKKLLVALAMVGIMVWGCHYKEIRPNPSVVASLPREDALQFVIDHCGNCGANGFEQFRWDNLPGNFICVELGKAADFPSSVRFKLGENYYYLHGIENISKKDFLKFCDAVGTIVKTKA